MSDFISVNELLKQAEQMGIDFGKGDPYNRLRYYTKMGWIPHMVRKKAEKGGTKGHYPTTTLDRLLLIQKLKEKGLDNDEIEKKLKMRDRVHNLYSLLRSDVIKNKIITYGSFLMLLVILLAQFNILNVGPPRNQLIFQNTTPQGTTEIADAGTAFVERSQNKAFVKSLHVYDNSRIYISFKDDYSPATRYWVATQLLNEGFEIELDSSVLRDSEFDWWITN